MGFSISTSLGSAIVEQHPVQKAGAVNADPPHEAEGQSNVLPEGSGPGDQRAHRQDARKEQHAKSLGQQHILWYSNSWLKFDFYDHHFHHAVAEADHQFMEGAHLMIDIPVSTHIALGCD